MAIKRRNPRSKFDKEKTIKAIHDCNGVIMYAAEQLGCHRTALARWRDNNPEVKQACDEAREAMLDTAEKALFQKIRDHDNACIIFFLRTQGKNRGYAQRGDVTVNEPVIIVTRDNSEEQKDQSS